MKASAWADEESLSTRLHSIIDYVQDCERRVLKGEIMDLTGLDRNIADLCHALTLLPREQALPLQSKVEVLIETLDILARAFQPFQNVENNKG